MSGGPSPSRRGRHSAGLLMYRRVGGTLEVLLAHPGGPYFARRHEGTWTIPKGEIEAGEEAAATARREFREETGIEPRGPLLALGSVRQRGGKLVEAWAVEAGEAVVASAGVSTFTVEWPPRSGRMQEFPEVDRVEFMRVDQARRLINPAQSELLDRLLDRLEGDGPGEPGA